jgi:cytochrome b
MDVNGAALRLIWEWPLRVWHWLLAGAVVTSLVTGLSGDIGWMDWHLRSGYAVCGLLLFRLLWGFSGGLYSRFGTYRTSVGALLAFVRRQPAASGTPADAHTAPGVLLVWFMLGVLLVQALTGLATSDDIFVEGPLVRHLPEDLVGLAGTVHHRVYYLVLAALAAHLGAHVVYGLARDPLPLAMFRGRKRVPAALQDTPQHGARALLLAVLVAALVALALSLA